MAVDKAGPTKETQPGRRPNLRDEQKRFTRGRLLDAALEVFNDKGYAATTIDQIVAAAGASRATFYLHFKAKPDLVQQLTQDHQSMTIGLYESIPLRGSSRKLTRAWVSRLVEHLESDPFIGIYDQAVSIEPSLAEQYESTIERLSSRLVERLDPPAKERAALTMQIRLLLVQLERSAYFWLIGGWKFDREVLIDGLTTMWLSAISSDGH